MTFRPDRFNNIKKVVLFFRVFRYKTLKVIKLTNEEPQFKLRFFWFLIIFEGGIEGGFFKKYSTYYDFLV